MVSPSIVAFSTLRARSYVFRLPLFTRVIVLVITAFWIASVQSAWDLRAWGALVPDKVSIQTLYRTNTYPFVHLNFLHALLNVVTLTPLLERFESEHGTLTSLALFTGPLSTLPALLYVLVEKFALHANAPAMGASVWVFLLLGIEAMRTYRTNPNFEIRTYSIPTWTTPLLLILVVAALVPSSSFLGHLCGLALGYVCGLGFLKYMAPSEKLLRWVEGKLNLLGRLPHYVSVDQKTYGRFGVLPSSGSGGGQGVSPTLVGNGQRLGP